MRKTTLTVLALTLVMSIVFTSCARFDASIKRSFQNSPLHYVIYQYSGDSLVFHDEFDGILNSSEHSDGYYYYKGDTLHEISGTTNILGTPIK